MRGSRYVALLLLCCSWLPATPARAQLEADERPRVSGPLALVNRICDSRTERAGGRIIATSRTCLRLYAFDPLEENDSARNFGVVWMQSNVDARGRRWCATEARSVIDLPRRVRVLERTPGDRRVSATRRIRARLKVDNATDQPAAIANGFRLVPRRLRTGLSDNGTSFHATWTGSTRRALGFALGVEVSWRADAGPPTVGSLLDFALVRTSNC